MGPPRVTCMRAVMNALNHMDSTGCQWRALDDRFPPVSKVRHCCYIWQRLGVLDGFLYDAGKKVNGRKRHIAVDTEGNVLVDEVLATAEQATALKVSTIMIQPPNRLGRHEERIIDFLTTVAEAFPELRIVLQNAPAPRGLNLDAMQLRRIVRSVEQIAYIKEETIPSGPTILALLNDPDRPDNLKGVIGGGGGRYIIDELRRGACAAMPAIELSDVQAALHAAWQAGDHSLADEIYTRSLPLLTMQAAYRMRLTKHVLIQRGILENAHVRASCPFMDGIAKAEANARLRDLLTYRKMQEMQQELEIEF